MTITVIKYFNVPCWLDSSVARAAVRKNEDERLNPAQDNFSIWL